jgi:hypothetical protein
VNDACAKLAARADYKYGSWVHRVVSSKQGAVNDAAILHLEGRPKRVVELGQALAIPRRAGASGG